MSQQVKFLLPEDRMPKAWYNIQADLPKALPPVLHPGTLQPIGPDDLAPLFPMELIMQEVSTEREIEIPEPVREVYKLWRPAPLFRAYGLERALQTPAKIYYKYEGVSPAGSHKPNTAIPQAFYNKQAGVKRLTTETGAGQWGSSIAYAGQMFGLPVRVFMVNVSYQQKPFRRSMMQTWGAEVFASPTSLTNAGRAALAVPIAAINGRSFLCCISIGADAHAVAGLSEPLKARIGRLAYLVAMLRALLRWRRHPVELHCDEGRYTAEAVFIMRGRYYAGPWTLDPAAGLAGEQLRILALPRARRRDVARVALHALLGGKRPARDWHVITTRRIAISAGQALTLQIDGDHAPHEAVMLDIAMTGQTVHFC